MAIVKNPLSFNVSHTSKKAERYRLGSSIGAPLNHAYWIIEMSVGLSSKLWASTVGQAILKVMPWTPGLMKS